MIGFVKPCVSYGGLLKVGATIRSEEKSKVVATVEFLVDLLGLTFSGGVAEHLLISSTDLDSSCS